MLRVFYYYFATLLVVQFGLQFLILGTLGPRAIEKIAAGEKGVVDAVLWLAFQALLLPLVYFLTSHFTAARDGRQLGEIGLAWPPGTTSGLFFAAALAAILLGIFRLLAGQWLQVEVQEIAPELQTPWLPLGPTALALLVLGLFASAFFDELMFRGYLYSTLREKFSWVHAAGLSNLLYLSFHGFAPEVGAAAMINALPCRRFPDS